MLTHQVRHISEARKADTKKPIPIAIGRKEPALFQRFRDTLRRGGHKLSIQVTKTKGEHITGSLLLCWLTNINSSSYRYQPISGRRNSIGFCCYLHHQFFNQQRLRAGHKKIPAQQQALVVSDHCKATSTANCKLRVILKLL